MKFLSKIKKTTLLLSLASFFIAGHAIEISASDQSDNSFGYEIYKARRQKLIDSLDGGIAILYSQGESSETGYRSDAHFWYLTGLDDPGAILVLIPGGVDQEILLLKNRDTEKERWIGERPNITDSITQLWQYDFIARTSRLNGIIYNRMKEDPKFYLISPMAYPSSDIPKDLAYYRKVSNRILGVKIENGTRLIEQMRMIKTDKEIKAIEQAIHITYQGITDLLAQVKPGVTEFQLDGILEQSFKNQGAQHMAFPPIVGAGYHSTILHYERRNQKLEDGQLLLLDVGAQWNHYCADISRTFPVNGKFNQRQAEIYDLVIKAQQAAFDKIKPGVTIREVHDAARNVIKEAGYGEYFIHGTAHHLGLDVHDISNRNLDLAAGMIITVEPGIYIPDENLGVRIEDDVLVTKKGMRILSSAIPRLRPDVEDWINSAWGK